MITAGGGRPSPRVPGARGAEPEGPPRPAPYARHGASAFQASMSSKTSSVMRVAELPLTSP
jgi:hypothetical protein